MPPGRGLTTFIFAIKANSQLPKVRGKFVERNRFNGSIGVVDHAEDRLSR